MSTCEAYRIENGTKICEGSCKNVHYNIGGANLCMDSCSDYKDKSL